MSHPLQAGGISMSQAPQTDSLLSDKNKIHEIPLDKVEPDKDQLRKEFRDDEIKALAETIKSDGQIQPILVTKGKDGKYKIVDGERRWRAFNLLAKQTDLNESQSEPPLTIKAIYVEQDNKLLGILGNILRNSYNPMETADAIALVRNQLGKNVSDEDVAKRIGKSRSLIAEYKSLLNLPKEIQEKARKNSYVPFRKLKTLAPDNEKTSKQKIAEYDKLHEKYEILWLIKTGKEKKAKSENPKKMDVRKAFAVQKKLEGVKSIIKDFSFGKEVEKADRDNFKASLQELIDAANAALQKLQ